MLCVIPLMHNAASIDYSFTFRWILSKTCARRLPNSQPVKRFLPRLQKIRDLRVEVETRSIAAIIRLSSLNYLS